MAKIFIDENKIKWLKKIDTKDLKIGFYIFPDFLLIGPQRTGTTWLFRNLIRHPDIFMPYEKEVFYFSHLEKEKSKYFRSDRLEWYSSRFKTTLNSYLRTNYALYQDFRDIKTLRLNPIKFFSCKIKGEATASYAVMNENIINEICILHPDIKIILLLRHPIERAWSHAKKNLSRDKNIPLSELKYSAFHEFYNSKYQISCGNYTTIIERWNKFIKKENFFIDLFDNIQKNPSELLLKIIDFLNIKKNPYNYFDPEITNTTINATQKKPIPERDKEALKYLFESEILKINERYNACWKL
jgi:hypothetical protein